MISLAPFVIALAILAAAQTVHAIGLLAIVVVPTGYQGPTLVTTVDEIWLPVELTATVAVGEFGPGPRAVLESRAGRFDLTTSDGFSLIRGALRRAPRPSAVLARVRAREGTPLAPRLSARR